MPNMQKEQVTYSSEYQPKKDKIALSMVVSLFFSFNLMFFAPVDFYLSNWKSLSTPVVNMLYAFIPATVILCAAVTVICIALQKRYHITIISVVFGIGLAMYIQGNFLSADLNELDGTKYEPGALKIIVNIIIWAVIIAVPFLIYKFNRQFFKSFIKYGSLLVLVIEIITLCVVFINLLILTNILDHWNADKYICTDKDEYTYSSNKNYIIILTDAYDSLCFDYSIDAEPDCISGFGGFTYYRDTLGMYTYTLESIPYILTGEYIDNISNPSAYNNELLFCTLQENYKMNIYGSSDIFTEEFYLKYADNYLREKYTYKDYIRTWGVFSKVTMYRYMPSLFKDMFWVYSDDINSEYSFNGVKSYSYDDLDFYNSLESTLDITDENCFKFIYLFGLHSPQNIAPDLQRVEDWSVSGDEQAIAMNKILSAYFDMLRENGVYDNSEIILLADHGLNEKENDRRCPLLMIKRAGAADEEMVVSNAPISQADVYPTLLYLAGYDTEGMEQRTVFDIKEDEERERYFAGTDEYITGNIK